MATLTYNGLALEVIITPTANRHTYFDLNPKGISVRQGIGQTQAKIYAYLQKNFIRFFNHYQHNKKYFDTPTTFLLFNTEYPVVYQKDSPKFTFNNNKLIINEKYYATYQKIFSAIRKQALMVLINKINHELSPKLLALKLSLVPIKIKKLSAKFGYCDLMQRQITVSLFLAKLPPTLITHVICHEYSHLLERGHNQAFYNILAKLDKFAKINRQAIKKIKII